MLAPLLAAMTLAAAAQSAEVLAPSGETRYLAFQVFTGSPEPTNAIGGTGLQPLGPLPTEAALIPFVQDIKTRIGAVGSKQSKLAVIFGPLSFDQSDLEIKRFVAEAFDLSLKLNTAVGFHIDDSLFWARRTDLWRDPANVEWMDWKGTATTGRRIDWGPKPKKLPPQMCFNSKPIEAEVRRRSTQVIGNAIRAGMEKLRAAGREELFAGIIVGWETMIGQDFDTGCPLGYHALANLGFSATHPPGDVDAAREKVVQGFITLWCKGLVDAGIPGDKLYSHTAFLARRSWDEDPNHRSSYSEHNHFAPPSVSFGPYRRPGFSTYPQPGHFEQIYDELAKHGKPSWASSEGTNLQLGSGPGQSGMNMETYLGRMFNHGATLVNVFSWGLGGEAHKNMDFRVVTEGPEALSAYRKFLRGERLVELASTTTVLERLPTKIHRIQTELPVWIQKTGKQAAIEPLMKKLEAAIKANNLGEAERIADVILEMIDGKTVDAGSK